MYEAKYNRYKCRTPIVTWNPDRFTFINEISVSLSLIFCDIGSPANIVKVNSKQTFLEVHD